MQTRSRQNVASESGEPTSAQKETGSLASLDVSSVSRGIVQEDAAAFTCF